MKLWCKKSVKKERTYFEEGEYYKVASIKNIYIVMEMPNTQTFAFQRYKENIVPLIPDFIGNHFVYSSENTRFVIVEKDVLTIK